MQPAYDGVLQVEPTDHCNLKCRMCAPHFEGWETIHGVPRGTLEPALWARIVDGLVADDLRFDHVIFQWLGDPTLHDALPELVGLAAHRLAGRVGYLRIDTNAIALGPTMADALLDAVSVRDGPPLLLVCTLDAVTPETYARVKGRDRLALVHRHIRHLIRRRHQRGADCRVNLQLQFVVQAGNAHEVDRFLSYWRDLLACQGGPAWCDEIMFKRLSVGGGSAGQAAADALYETSTRHIRPGPDGPVKVLTWQQRPWQVDDDHRGERGPCPALWLTPVIRHDGELIMCCADLRGELALGSLAERSFRALWEGPRATGVRLAHLAGRFEGVCAGCGGVNWYITTPQMIEDATRRALELGLSEPKPNS